MNNLLLFSAYVEGELWMSYQEAPIKCLIVKEIYQYKHIKKNNG